MHNIEMKLVGNELVIVCGLTSAVAPARPDILASTRGNVTVEAPEGDLRVSLIVWREAKTAQVERRAAVARRLV